jgi:glycosyltransferase involved in cell wall biosynthesis
MITSSTATRWITTQIGAREHYAVPRALHRTGRLNTLFTDFWAGPVVRSVGRCLPGAGLRSLAARYHPDLGRAESWNWLALAWETAGRQTSKTNGPYSGFIEVGKKFAGAVRAKLEGRRDLSPETIFFAYDTGALETLEFLKKRGVRCVLNQIDPSRVEVSLVREEERRCPGWAARSVEVPEAYFQRREKEWTLADRIVVNSEFSRLALMQQGVPPEKLSVIPLCYETDDESRNTETRNQFQVSAFSVSTPLKVLFLGQVILRKGIRYLLEAAMLLLQEPVRFDVVGPIGISEAALRSAPPNVTFHGRANRDQAASWYQNAAVFVLPTLSDGFALTQLEAMAHGLPVIATPNCGVVVTNDEDGFLVEPRNATALARAIQRYLAEPELLRAHRAGACKKSGQFTLARLADNLTALESKLIG